MVHTNSGKSGKFQGKLFFHSTQGEPHENNTNLSKVFELCNLSHLRMLNLKIFFDFRM